MKSLLRLSSFVLAAMLCGFGATTNVYAQAPATPHQQINITELQQVKLANIELEREKILREGTIQLQTLQQQKQHIIDELLKANPGYSWHFPQSANDTEGLIKTPPPAAPQKPLPPGTKKQ